MDTNNQLTGYVMKMIVRLVVGLLVSFQVGFAAVIVSPVPFRVGPKHFRNGDRIVIKQVLATSPRLAVGDTVEVRGRYVLKSEEKAQLCLYLTTSEAVGAEPNFPTQTTEIRKGSGSFELAEKVRHAGHLHLSFYQISGGKRIGSVYFGTAQQMKEIRHWKLDD